MVKLLVEHGADVRARSKGDFTPLLFAAQQGDVESGRIMLESFESTADLLLKLAAKPLADSGVRIFDLFYKGQ